LARNDHQIDGAEVGTAKPDEGSDQPFPTIAHNGAAYTAAYHQTQPGARIVVAPEYDNVEALGAKMLALFANALKLGSVREFSRGAPTIHRNYFLYPTGASRLRPLARRRFNVRRPVAVSFRVRKPWVRRRRVVCG
jgi:hypothetical protein